MATAAKSGTAQSRFATHDSPDALIVSGELDADAAYRLFSRLLDSDGSATRIVDLSGVTFVDAVGLRALLHARRRLADDGVRLCILNPSPVVVRLCTLVGVTDILAD